MRISSLPARRLVLWLAALLSSVLATQTKASARPSFVLRPEPGWVTPIEIDRDDGSRDRPTSVLLDDYETKVSTGGVERFYQHSERVNTSAGLEGASQLRFYFEPSYQFLAIHFIRIIRDGQASNALEPSAIKIISKEDDLDEQVYNGTLAAIVFLKDVRVGDVIEYAYTVTGNNPVFGGRFADRYYLAGLEPIERLRVRLLAPSDRTFYFRNQGLDLSAKSSRSEAEVEYVWERSEVPAVGAEDATPAWFEPVPSVSVSEFADWQAVVKWAAPMYEPNQPVPPELRAKGENWVKQFATPEQRMIAALRFVQQEIRYLGIELGPYSHRPSPPSQTLGRRFGDCKDKSLLLTSVLKFMGIDAAVALVNTSAGKTLDSYQPSPNAFDHVIVQTNIGTRTFWLDPTIASQRGNVEAYYDPPYERALVLRPEVQSLATIPRQRLQRPTTEVEEFYTIDAISNQATLRVNTIYRGAEADDIRYRWSQRSAEETAKLYLNYYASDNPSIKAQAPPVIHDNEQDDVITIEEKYVIDSFWNNQAHYFGGNLAYEELPKPNISQRKMPLALRHPIFLTQTIQIDSIAADDLMPRSQVIASEAFSFEYRYQPSAGSIRLEYSLRTLSDYVPPDKVSAYMGQADRVWNSTGMWLPRRQSTVLRRTDPSASSLSVELLIGSVTFVVIAGVTAVVVIRRRRERRGSFLERPLPACAPETAVRCKQTDDIEAFSADFKCRCGNKPFTTDALSHREGLFYDGERLVTLKLKCKACGRASDLYFVQPPIADA